MRLIIFRSRGPIKFNWRPTVISLFQKDSVPTQDGYCWCSLVPATGFVCVRPVVFFVPASSSGA